jgi:hypothetical protein
LWVRDQEENRDDFVATASWIVEFFDAPLNPEQNFLVFMPNGLDELDRGFLTARTRFLLWLSLGNMAADLDGLVSESWGVGESIVKDDMPRMVQDQSREWWESMRVSAERLCEAARRGEIEELEPRTPAEEALIYLATQVEYVAWARDTLEMDGRKNAFEALPASSDDEEWGEILPQLTGDVDIEMLWHNELVGRAAPDDEMNRYLGLGDYRPEALHELFDHARRNGMP